MLSKLKKIVHTFQAILSNKFLRDGLPLLVLVIGGSFAVTYSQESKFKRMNEEAFREKMKAQGFDLKPINVENEQAKLQKANLDDWRNIRGPRAWEENENWEADKKKQAERLEKYLEAIEK